MLLMERVGSAEGIGAGDELMNPRRRRWSQRLAAFACGLATLTLMPLMAPAGEQIDVSLAALAGVIVASLMLGVGMQLHVGWLARRIGTERLRWIMLVLLGWSTAALGSADCPKEFLAAQLVVGVIAGATMATFALPGLPALYGAGVAALAGPALCRTLTGTVFGIEGSWPLVCGFSGAAVLALAAVSHALVRSPYLFESRGECSAKDRASSDANGEEIPVAAAVA
jgi:MFS family permease